jgi:hypothetical protein
LGEVVHRRHAEEISKALREQRARLAYLRGQLLDRPVMGCLRMHQRQRLADEGVAQAGEPASLLGRQGFQVLPYDLDEHQLAQLGEDAFAADALLPRFHHRQADELADPIGVACLWGAGLDHARQILEQRIERLGITGEIPANELGRGRSIAAIAQGKRQFAAGGGIQRATRRRLGAHAGPARDDVGIAMGKHDDVAGLERNRLPADEHAKAAAHGDDVIGDQMIRARQDFRQNDVSWCGFGDPWFRGGDFKKHGAGQAHGFEHVRERIRSH